MKHSYKYVIQYYNGQSHYFRTREESSKVWQEITKGIKTEYSTFGYGGSV